MKRIILLSIITTALTSGQTAPSSYNHGDSKILDADYSAYTLTTSPISVTITGNGDSVVNGNSFQGFQFSGTKTQFNNVSINVSGVSKFTNFTDKPDSNDNTLEGGAVFALVNGGHLTFSGYSEDNRLIFNGNEASSDGNSSAGSAIWVEGSGTVGDIYADFTNNKLTPNAVNTGSQYSRGGAISISRWISAPTNTPLTMGNIYGNFEGNQAEYGGAIYIGPAATVGDIDGNFINNIATVKLGPSVTGGSGGGAIRLYGGIVGDIHADFTSNITRVTSGTASGGAIAMHNSGFKHENHGLITGDMKGNIAFSEASIGRGGALSLTKQLENTKLSILDADILDNVAATQTSNDSNAKGGAFYLEDWTDLTITAETQNVLISGNYETWDATLTIDDNGEVSYTSGSRNYNAIYAHDSTVTLHAKNDSMITLNDSIKGSGSSTIKVQGDSSKQYDVSINASVTDTHLTVVSGGLILGSAQHSYTDSSGNTTQNVEANFINSSLTVNSEATVNTTASYFEEATYITNEGRIEFTGGTLHTGINDASNMLGDLHILGNTTFDKAVIQTTAKEAPKVYADKIYIDSNLSLAAAVSCDANTILYKGANMDEINLGEQIILTQGSSLDFDFIQLEIDTATINDYFDLIVSDGFGNITFDQNYDISFYLGGTLLGKSQYVVEELEDGGLRVRFLLPEPSTVTLSLLALTALSARRRRLKNS